MSHRYHYRPPRADHPLLASAPFAHAAAPEVLPPSVDLRRLCLPVRDQGQEGACSGFSASAWREVSHAAAAGSPLPGWLSPAYLYARTRIEEGTFPQDAGGSIADEFFILQNFGVCPDSVLLYTGDPTEGPTPVSDVAAVPFRLAPPLQVTIEEIAVKSALANSQAVSIGFTVYESFETPDASGVVPLPNTAREQMLGGHGVLVVGYDDAAQHWIVRNSWGAGWGDGGYVYMPYGYETLWNEAWTGVVTN
jgi:hypothetical protein